LGAAARAMNLAGWVDKWSCAADDGRAIVFGGATYSTNRQWAGRARPSRQFARILASNGGAAMFSSRRCPRTVTARS